MTVYELHKLTAKWLYEGHGDKIIYQWYDCNECCTGIGGVVKINDNVIDILESDYLVKLKKGK